MAERIAIPRLGINRPSAPAEHNPHEAQVLDMALGWAAARLSDVLPEHFESLTEVGTSLAATVAPQLDLEGLKITALQCAWLFGFDAPADGEVATDQPTYAAAFSATRNVLDNPTLPAKNLFAKALQDVALLVGGRSTPQQFNRWANSVNRYLDGVLQEMAYRREGTAPLLTEFIAMRRNTSGVGVVLNVIEPAGGFTIPDSIWNNIAASALTGPAIDSIAFDNCLLSYNREAARGDAELNLVTVLQKARKRSVQEAADEAVKMRNAKETEFLRAHTFLQEDNGTDPTLLTYAAGVKGWINGNLPTSTPVMAGN